MKQDWMVDDNLDSFQIVSRPKSMAALSSVYSAVALIALIRPTVFFVRVDMLSKLLPATAITAFWRSIGEVRKLLPIYNGSSSFRVYGRSVF